MITTNTMNDWNGCEENVASICAIPNTELPDEATCRELMRLALAGQDVYAYMSAGPDHFVVWVRQPYPYLEARFVPMDWARLRQASLQPDEAVEMISSLAGDEGGFAVAAVDTNMSLTDSDVLKRSRQRTKLLAQRVQGRFVSWLKSLLGLLLLVLLLTACDIGPGVAEQDPTPVPVHSQLQQRPPLYVQISPDITGSYPHSMTLAFLKQMASWVDAIPRVGTSTATVYVSYLSHAPYRPESNPLTFTIPGVPNYPAPPHHVAVPQCPQSPYSCTHARDKAMAANQAADQAYQQQVAAVQMKLAKVQQETQLHSAELRALRPGVDQISTSVYGILNLAAARFKLVSGDKYLLVASDLGNNSSLDEVPPDLTGVHVIVELYCLSAVSCSHTEATWNGVFQRAHVASIRWLEPAQAQTVSSPWS